MRLDSVSCTGTRKHAVDSRGRHQKLFRQNYGRMALAMFSGQSILKQWLTSGYMEKHVFMKQRRDSARRNYLRSARQLRAGWAGATPEGKVPHKRNVSSPLEVKPCVNLVRYADDLVSLVESKPTRRRGQTLVEQFLQERGLELSPTKTVITHVENGFDFLGQNVRRYPMGNCSSSLPARMSKSSWIASDKLSKPRLGCLPPI